MSTTAEQDARALLAAAEFFRSSQPPKYKTAIKCALATQKLILPSDLEANCLLQIGKLLWFYSEEYEMAKYHLERAYAILYEHRTPQNTPVRLQTLIYISHIYLRMGHNALDYLRAEKVEARAHPRLYLQILVLIVEFALQHDTPDVALRDTAHGVAYTQQCGDRVGELYFRITHAAVLVRSGAIVEADDNTRAIVEGMTEMATTEPPAVMTNLRAFFFAMQLIAALHSQKARVAKTALRSFQQTVQEAAKFSAAPSSGIRWLDVLSQTALACLLTLAHAMMSCQHDRVQKYYALGSKQCADYFDRTLANGSRVVDYNVDILMWRLRDAFHEFAVHLNIAAGKPNAVLQPIRTLLDNRIFNGGGWSAEARRVRQARIHALLGLHATYAGDVSSAELQFNQAKRLAETDSELHLLVCLSLGALLLSTCQLSKFYVDVIEHVSIKRCDGAGMSNARIASRLLRAVLLYLSNSKPDEMSALLTESAAIATEDESHRLYAQSVLLFYSFAPAVNPTDLGNALRPVYSWLKREDLDTAISTGVAQLLNNVASAGGHSESERAALRSTLDGHISRHAAYATEARATSLHPLLQWLDGDPSKFLPAD